MHPGSGHGRPRPGRLGAHRDRHRTSALISSPLALALALAALAVTLISATVRPRLLPEWACAAAGSLLLIALGAISWHGARAACGDLGSTVGFLAALLVLAEAARREGVFEALGMYLGAASEGRPQRLFGFVFIAATAVTVVLGLDATVVLLTPVVLVTAARTQSNPKPSLYACAHLANSASLLLPVSNLTNLLAFHSSRLTFTRFAIVMALPWALAVAIEWLVLRRSFGAEPPDHRTAPAGQAVPLELHRLRGPGRYALAVLGLTLLGFCLSSVLRVAPLWFAVAGAVLVALPPLLRDGTAVARDLVRAAQPGFLLFVLGLGVIVHAAAGSGLHAAVTALLPGGGSPGDLILVALIAGLLANIVNNLPATLILVPVAGAAGLGPLLAVLVGVNIGPNLTYGGSLATLLWRRIVHPGGLVVELGEFSRLGIFTVVPSLVLCALAVWASVSLVGP